MMFRKYIQTLVESLCAAIVMLSGCAITPENESPMMRPLSFDYSDGTPADITIVRYTDLLESPPIKSTPVPIVCQGRTQQAQIAPVRDNVYIYCSFPMGQTNPAPYENNQPTEYQTVTLGQTSNGAFTPALRFGMVDDDRTCAKGRANYTPGLCDGAIEYYGMYARPATTYDFKIKLDLAKGKAMAWVTGRGDDQWFPLAFDAQLINPVTAINAVRIDQLPEATGIQNLVIQSQPWANGENVRPHPMAKKDRLVGLGKGYKLQKMRSFWRDADRHVTVARIPNAEKGWWLGFPEVVQTGPTTLVACYADGYAHGASGQFWAKHSGDLGKTWHDPVVISPGPTNSPRLQKLSDGTLLALADFYEPLYPCQFFQSTDGGYTWTHLGKLDPVASGGPESCVPSRVVEMPDGSWLLVASHCPGKPGQLTEGESLEFYRSPDRAKTWAHYSTLKPPYPHGLSEATIVPLPDGRWVLYARDGSSSIPGIRSYSSDLGKTWSTPEELPFLVDGRTCAALLKDGRVLLTTRSQCGFADLWAWTAYPDEPLTPYVHGTHINDRNSTGLNRQGLFIDSDGWCSQFTNYRFRPPDTDQSRIEVTVEVKVLSNAGLAATLSIPFVGKLRFFPDKVRIMGDCSAEVAVSTSDFHTYRIVGEGTTMTLFIDGRQAFTSDNLKRQTVSLAWSPIKLSPYALEFGNEPADKATAAFDWVPEIVREQAAEQPEESVEGPQSVTLKTITPMVNGSSIWRKFSAKYDDPRTGDYQIAWSANSGTFPDQYQLDRLVEIEGSISGWDQGYSGWVQLHDGRILILNYTDDTARFNRHYPNGGTSWIRGTFVSTSDLPPLH